MLTSILACTAVQRISHALDTVNEELSGDQARVISCKTSVNVGLRSDTEWVKHLQPDWVKS